MNKVMLRSMHGWIKAINQQHNVDSDTTTFDPKHEKLLIKDLKHVEKLIAFSNALNYFKVRQSSEFCDKYMDMLMRSEIFHTLAVMYKQKKNEEQAYFAYFISQYPQVLKNTEGVHASTIDTMVSYIEASDIYCRANVLKALCRLGDINGIINVLQFFSDKYKFIHHKLLAEDLFSFEGDKEVLALYLWGRYKIWNDNIMLGVITFITMFSDGFKDAFLSVLQNKSANADVRLAIIRYYKEYNFLPAQPILIEYLSQTENYDFATEAASTLSSYPGYITINALISALQSDNWFVQYNAASSLVVLSEHLDSFNELPICNGDTLQIIQYLLEHKSGKKDIKDMNVSELII